MQVMTLVAACYILTTSSQVFGLIRIPPHSLPNMPGISNISILLNGIMSGTGSVSDLFASLFKPYVSKARLNLLKEHPEYLMLPQEAKNELNAIFPDEKTKFFIGENSTFKDWCEKYKGPSNWTGAVLNELIELDHQTLFKTVEFGNIGEVLKQVEKLLIDPIQAPFIPYQGILKNETILDEIRRDVAMRRYAQHMEEIAITSCPNTGYEYFHRSDAGSFVEGVKNEWTQLLNFILDKIYQEIKNHDCIERNHNTEYKPVTPSYTAGDLHKDLNRGPRNATDGKIKFTIPFTNIKIPFPF